MKKYSDWQRYVKEQIDGMGKPGQESAPSTGAAPGPTVEREKFVIRKTEPAAPEPQPRQAAPAFPPHPAKKIPSQQPQQKDQQDLFAAPQQTAAGQAPPQRAPEAERPIASPFVSVHDVWKAAEKTARTQPREKLPPEPPPAPRHEPKPPAPARQVAYTQPPSPPPPEKPAPKARAEELPAQAPLSPQRQSSREEIIERLVNPTLSLEEAARIMGVCKATVRRYTAMGILPHYRTPGNQRRFKLNDIILFIEDQKK